MVKKTKPNPVPSAHSDAKTWGREHVETRVRIDLGEVRRERERDRVSRRERWEWRLYARVPCVVTTLLPHCKRIYVDAPRAGE